jgi:nucleotide-binding universal stress UspA family protein
MGVKWSQQEGDMRSGTFHILVGIDFSDSSAGAMYHALALAERLGAVLHLVHVAPAQAHLTVPTDIGMNMPTEFEEVKEARERLERLRAMIGEKASVELHLRMGDPVRGLIEVIRELRPDMVVIGSHGRSAVMRMLLGSVSTQIIHQSPVPVLVVPAPGREAAQPAEAPAVEPPLPSVGQSPNEVLDYSQTNDSASGSVNIAPGGTEGYDVNPELRVRY